MYSTESEVKAAFFFLPSFIMVKKGFVPVLSHTSCSEKLCGMCGRLLVKESSIFVWQESGWAPEPVLTLCRNEKFLGSSKNQPHFMSTPLRNFVVIQNWIMS
jgi:hypothetical protein